MMPDIPQGFIGTLPGWLTFGSIVTLIGIVLKYRLGQRGLSIEQQKQSASDEADIRDHWSHELERMQRVITELRDRADAQDRRLEEQRKAHDAEKVQWERRWREAMANHDECMKERADLWKKIKEQDALIDGLKRQILSQATDRVLVMEEKCDPKPHSTAAAHRVKKITNGDK